MEKEIPDKDFYMKEIDMICNMIRNRAEDILQDWNKGIRKIIITSEIEYGTIPSVSITKEYIPYADGGVISCHLNENSSENN